MFISDEFPAVAPSESPVPPSSPIITEKPSTNRTTITVRQGDTTENQLRQLLRAERKRNLLLSSEYRTVQNRNVELITEIKRVKAENGQLLVENEKLLA